MKPQRPLHLFGRDLADAVITIANEKKAENILLLDCRKTTATAEWMVICEGDNTVHVSAIADDIVRSIRKQGCSAWHTEGLVEGHWALADYSDVIVHVMLAKVRSYYSIEELWPEAKKIRIKPD